MSLRCKHKNIFSNPFDFNCFSFPSGSYEEDIEAEASKYAYLKGQKFVAATTEYYCEYAYEFCYKIFYDLYEQYN